MRDKNTKESFIKYLNDPKNRDLRFWQALTVFTGKGIFFGYMENGGENFKDTFYIEADEDRQGEE